MRVGWPGAGCRRPYLRRFWYRVDCGQELKPEVEGARLRTPRAPELDFGHSGGVAEGVGDALAEGWREFRGIDGLPGHGETLFASDFPPYCGEAVGEGRPLLVVPGAGLDLDPGTAVEARRQQGDDREQPEQAGRGAGDRLVRPLTLGLDAEVVAHLAEGDFQLPALDEPADDLQRLLRQVGAEQRLWFEAAAGVAQQHPADRHDRQAAVTPDGGVRAELHPVCLDTDLSNRGPI